ncbi:zinc-ribbon domain-containing protein [Thermoanaerobacter thermocopriae]|uniref:zinc-ribbon domain-containing protein n=1 Tax=Thermoanaerobacter thermocopriae TaxID=29350 RepID=UPI00048DA398|nr:zinc-ribbon domain-containing protein [Thermoanaerobacter thermocopriae]
MYQDKMIVCKDCGKEFVWTAGEQQFYAEKGFQNEPVRCKACRDAKKRRNHQYNARKNKKAFGIER